MDRPPALPSTYSNYSTLSVERLPQAALSNPYDSCIEIITKGRMNPVLVGIWTPDCVGRVRFQMSSATKALGYEKN
jgi:hypothetical protein